MKTFTHDEEDKYKKFQLSKESIEELNRYFEDATGYITRIRSGRITATESVVANARQASWTDRMRRRWIDEEL